MSESIPRVCLACKHIRVDFEPGYYGDDYSGGLSCGLGHWSLTMSHDYVTIKEVREAFATAQTCPDYVTYTPKPARTDA